VGRVTPWSVNWMGSKDILGIPVRKGNTKMSDRELCTCKKCNSLHEGNGDFCGICQDGIIERMEKEIESLKLTMQIHAGDICSANNEADRFIDMNQDLEDENRRLRKELEKLLILERGPP